MTKRSASSKMARAKAAAKGCDCASMETIAESTVKAFTQEWHKGGPWPLGAGAHCPECGEDTWIDMPPEPLKRTRVH